MATLNYVHAFYPVDLHYRVNCVYVWILFSRSERATICRYQRYIKTSFYDWSSYRYDRKAAILRRISLNIPFFCSERIYTSFTQMCFQRRIRLSCHVVYSGHYAGAGDLRTTCEGRIMGLAGEARESRSCHRGPDTSRKLLIIQLRQDHYSYTSEYSYSSHSFMT